MQNEEQIRNFKIQFDNLVASKSSIMITAHKGPDDDSIASMLGVYRYLKQKYPQKSVEVFTFSIPEERWSSFQDFNVINFVTESQYDFSRFDLLIGVDCSQFSRFNPVPNFFASFKGDSVCIDHHKSEPDDFTISLILSNYSSNAELIHNIFYADQTIDAITAEIILLGILGDTGNFRFVNSSQSDVFLVAKRLVDAAQINIQSFLARYSTYPERSFKALQYIVKNAVTLEVSGWPRFIYSYIDRQFVEEYKLDDGEISAATHIFIAQYGTTLNECSWGFVLSPRSDNSVSVSMRSRPGSVNVRMIGEQTGKGGGHDRAGGMKFLQENHVYDTKECLDWILAWMKENKPTIA